MPGWSGALGSNLYKSYGLNLATSGGTILTGATLIHTKTGYTPLCQSLEFNASGILVGLSLNAPGSTPVGTYVDVAVGAIGSEVVIINDLLIGAVRAEESIHYIFDRLPIPAGSRLSARYQTGNTGTTSDIVLIPFLDDISDVLTLGRAVTYGLLPPTTAATTVDPGGTANTLGAWTAIVGSTIEPVRSMIIYHSQLANQALSTARFIIDIGVGAAGSEVVLFTYPMSEGVTSDMFVPRTVGPLHVSIPAGTRISARARCSINDASDRLFGMVIYCMD